MRSRSALLLAVPVLTVAALSGCGQEPAQPGGTATPPPSTSTAPSPSPSASATVAPTTAPTASPTTAPTPTADPPTPLALDCGALLPIEALTKLGSNISVFAATDPAAGGLAAQALADQGTLCRIVQNSSGATIDVAVSQPSPAALRAAEDAAAGAPYDLGVAGATGYATEHAIEAFAGGRRYSAEAPTYFDVQELGTVLIVALGG